MTKYRGITVPEDIAASNIAYKALWEKGVDIALDTLIKAVESECKSLEDDGTNWFPDEWASGRIEGKEMAAEYIRDVLDDYK